MEFEAPPFKGLGEKVEDIKKLLEKDEAALALFTELTKAGKGGQSGNQNAKTNADNISIRSDLLTVPEPTKEKADAGTSRAYTLVRLKNERPDLFSKVCAKELTANAAAKQAGWRKEQSPLDAAKRAWKKMSADEQTEFLTWAANEG